MFVTEQLNLQMSALQRKNKTKAFRSKYNQSIQDTKNKGGIKANKKISERKSLNQFSPEMPLS